MKVLKNNYNTVFADDTEKELICEVCTSQLEYDDSDIVIGQYGCAFVKCPLCGYENYLDDCKHEITLTKNNVEFPTHFAHTSEETGAVNCFTNNEIKAYINKAIEYFRNNKDADHWFTCTGNLYISVTRWEGDENYWVVVSNDHYDTYIPFEAADY